MNRFHIPVFMMIIIITFPVATLQVKWYNGRFSLRKAEWFDFQLREKSFRFTQILKSIMSMVKKEIAVEEI